MKNFFQKNFEISFEKKISIQIHSEQPNQTISPIAYQLNLNNNNNKNRMENRKSKFVM